jgi:hypothetical protein
MPAAMISAAVLAVAAILAVMSVQSISCVAVARTQSFEGTARKGNTVAAAIAPPTMYFEVPLPASVTKQEA